MQLQEFLESSNPTMVVNIVFLFQSEKNKCAQPRRSQGAAIALCIVTTDTQHYCFNSLNLLTAQRASPNESNVLKIAGGWRREGGCSGRNQTIARDSSANTNCPCRESGRDQTIPRDSSTSKTVPAERTEAADL